MDNTGLRIERAQSRGLVGRNPNQDIWHILEEVDNIVPWQKRYPGTPNVFDVWRYVAPELKTLNIHIYRHLKLLIAEMVTYDYMNFYLLR